MAEVTTLREEFPSATFNLEIEQGILGAAMVHGVSGLGSLKPEHLFDPLHQRIMRAIIHLASEGKEASPRSLKAFFETDEGIARVGGVKYLAQLASGAPPNEHSRQYVAFAMELWQRRSMIQACYETISKAGKPDIDEMLQSVIDGMQQRLNEIQNEGPMARPVLAGSLMARLLQDTRARMDGTAPVPHTGLSGIDQKLGGFRYGNQVLLAGRPGIGKTALGLSLAYKAAVANPNYVVVFFSLEMTAQECLTRLACELASTGGHEIAYEDVLNGTVKPHQLERLAMMESVIASSSLYIDDQPRRSVASIFAECQAIARESDRMGNRLGLVVIDHLRRIADSGNYKNNANKSEGEKAKMLKDAAKMLNCTVLTLVQLNRGVEGRDDKRPSLADLRDSGEIEEEADSVMMVYRDYYYRQREKPPGNPSAEADWRAEIDAIKDQAEVYITKNRHGQNGRVMLRCNMATNSFWDISARTDQADML